MADDNLRSSLHMVVRFWPEHETKPVVGVMSAFSKSEITFTTDRRLKMGEVIKVSICKKDEKTASCTKPVFTKVSKIKQLGLKSQVTANFIKKEKDDDFDETSRRKYDRIPVELTGKYRKDNLNEFMSCKVLDLSRSGARFVCKGPVKKYSKVELMVLPQENGALKHMLHVFLVVARCQHLGKSIYEIGGEFMDVLHKKKKLAADEGAEKLYGDGEEEEGELKVKYDIDEAEQKKIKKKKHEP